jgi:tripartite-type tricarboxylate transporter receptor subunit TctC
VFPLALTRRGAARTAATLFALLLPPLGPALAQSDYPNRPIRVLVAVAPGGVTDLAARSVTPKFNELFGQQFLVENRPGAGGVIGTEMAAKAPADGYTLIFVSAAEMTVNPGLLPKLPYNPQRDFAPIGPVSNTVLVLAAHPSQPLNNVGELVAYAKSRPGQIAFASAGNGTVNHITGEWFANLAGLQLVHVPYRGGGPATLDVVGGQVPVGVLAISSAIQHVKGGKLKVLGVSSSKRVSFVPDWPTIAEQGFPNFDSAVWVGLFAPAGTPAPIIQRLNVELNRVLRMSDVRERLNAQGAEVLGGSPEQLAAMIRDDQARYARLIKQYGIKPD